MKELVYTGKKLAIEDSDDLLIPKEYPHRCRKCGRQSLNLFDGCCLECYIDKVTEKKNK